MTGISTPAPELERPHVVVGVQNMLVFQKGFSFSWPVRGLVSIPEVSTTSCLDEFSWGIHLSYPKGMWKESRES
jgi:hypothetical protein